MSTPAADGSMIRGWIRTRLPSGKAVVDTRDHLEYQKVIHQAPVLDVKGQPIDEVGEAEVHEPQKNLKGEVVTLLIRALLPPLSAAVFLEIIFR